MEGEMRLTKIEVAQREINTANGSSREPGIQPDGPSVSSEQFGPVAGPSAADAVGLPVEGVLRPPAGRPGNHSGADSARRRRGYSAFIDNWANPVVD